MANVFSSPEIFGGLYKNINPLNSLVMCKNLSQIELLSSNKKRKDEFQIKTEIYPNLPILRSSKKVTKYPMKFPVIQGDFTTPFFQANL